MTYDHPLKDVCFTSFTYSAPICFEVWNAAEILGQEEAWECCMIFFSHFSAAVLMTVDVHLNFNEVTSLRDSLWLIQVAYLGQYYCKPDKITQLAANIVISC